jgi:hypothetical protein
MTFHTPSAPDMSKRQYSVIVFSGDEIPYDVEEHDHPTELAAQRDYMDMRDRHTTVYALLTLHGTEGSRYGRILESCCGPAAPRDALPMYPPCTGTPATAMFQQQMRGG